MIDFCSFQIKEFTSIDFENLVRNWVFQTPINFGNRYQVDWQNLRINYYPNQKIIKISNSLHKWYNSEIAGIGRINYNEFTKSQVIDSVSYLETAFNRKASQMKLLGRFEYGININTSSIKPYDIIDRYVSIVTTSINPFYAFYNKHGRPYSKFCSFTNYNVKAYDKSKEAGLSYSNIFRFEVVHHNAVRTKQVFGKNDVTLMDLMNSDSWEKCFNSLLKSYNSIRMLGFPENGTEAYAKILCYSHPIIRKDFKADLRKIKKELKEAHDLNFNSKDNPHFLIKNGLINNYQKLITN